MAWSAVKFVFVTTPMAFCLGVLIELVVGKSAGTAIEHAVIFAAIWAIAFGIGGVIERSVYGPGGRQRWVGERQERERQERAQPR